jgi:hypothetical protein
MLMAVRVRSCQRLPTLIGALNRDVSDLLGWTGDPMEKLALVFFVLGFVPVLGTALDLVDFLRAMQSGNIPEALINLVPALGDIKSGLRVLKNGAWELVSNSRFPRLARFAGKVDELGEAIKRLDDEIKRLADEIAERLGLKLPERVPEGPDANVQRFADEGKTPSGSVPSGRGGDIPRLTVHPNNGGRMLGEAIGHLKALPQDLQTRTAWFDDFVQQIHQADPGWNAPKDILSDGGVIYLGEFGEALVIDPHGNIFRGKGRLTEDLFPIPTGVKPHFRWNFEKGVRVPIYESMRRIE